MGQGENELVAELGDKVERLEKHLHDDTVANRLYEKIKQLETLLSVANKEATDAKADVVTLTKSLGDVTKSCTNLDNFMRRDNLLFNNVKQTRNENCFLVIHDLLTKMEIENAKQLPIVRCHRLYAGQNAPQSINQFLFCFGFTAKTLARSYYCRSCRRYQVG